MNAVDRHIAGCLAASVTPFRQDGESLDEGAFDGLTDFMVGAGLDGFLAMGTTGEGVLLTIAERKLVTDLFVKAARSRLKVVVHAGAQTTRDTSTLSAHAADSGADGVAVIGPPYYPLDEQSMLEHFASAGRACAPLPFYVYEFAARSGYAVPLSVISKLRDRLPNLAGLKVSDTPWDKFETYLIEGLSIFVGSEGLIHQAMERGAVGAVSALASALPELVIEAVRSRGAEASQHCVAARAEIQKFPFQSALKSLLADRGVAITDRVRAPLRRISPDELATLKSAIADLVGPYKGSTTAQ
jgi:dihydrodipicolinate synthase/N-acetylneuraminate lyase